MSDYKRAEYFLSRLPLIWMAAEAEKAGLLFDTTGIDLDRDGLPHPGIDLREDSYRRRLVGGQAIDLIAADRSASREISEGEVGPLHSELEFGHGWSSPHVCKQIIKNMVYSKTFHRSTALERGQREIPVNAAVHASVIRRMTDDNFDQPPYQPSNLHLENPYSLTMVDAEDPINGYFIYKPPSSGN